jgi:hypothetical protein
MTTATKIGHECKHALYFTATDNSPNDCLVVKEYEHFDDGTKVPRLRFVQNYQRPFWVTKKELRVHKDKKEWELESRTRKSSSTQIKLVQAVGRALERPGLSGNLRMVARSPYVYGFDVTTPVLIKHEYMKKWPDLHARGTNLVAVLDIETDMVLPTNHPDHGKMIMGSVTMKDKARIVVLESYFAGIDDPINKLQAKFTEYLGEYQTKRGIKLEVVTAKTPGEAAYKLIQTAHEWKPDILTIWNMNFDIPKLVKVLEDEGYNLAEVFSDPSCPQVYKYFRYIEGAAQKVTQSGKVLPLHPAERWHVAECPASFYILDAMCVYLKIRIAAGKEASYSLDYILQKVLGIRKLKFDAASQYVGGKWHTFMQQNYKLEYCVYNVFDCISTEELDEKTTDLGQMISVLCGHSEYHRFPSQPRRTCDDLHFFCLEQNPPLVAATTSDKMMDDLDQHVVSINDWIVTLPSYLVTDEGICALEELPNVRTLMRAHVADLDVEGTYPNVEIIANISKKTTAKELCKIEGVEETVQRAVGINLSGGYVNAVEICCAIYKAPTLDEMLQLFLEKQPGTSLSATATLSMSEGLKDLVTLANQVNHGDAAELAGTPPEPEEEFEDGIKVEDPMAGLIEFAKEISDGGYTSFPLSEQTEEQRQAAAEQQARWQEVMADPGVSRKEDPEDRQSALAELQKQRLTTISLERQHLWDSGCYDRDAEFEAYVQKDVSEDDIRRWVAQEVHEWGYRRLKVEHERHNTILALEKELRDEGREDLLEAFRALAADPSVGSRALKAWVATKIFEAMFAGEDTSPEGIKAATEAVEQEIADYANLQRQQAVEAIVKQLEGEQLADLAETFIIMAAGSDADIPTLHEWVKSEKANLQIAEGEQAQLMIAEVSDLIRTERGDAAADAFDEEVSANESLFTTAQVEAFLKTYCNQIDLTIPD